MRNETHACMTVDQCPYPAVKVVAQVQTTQRELFNFMIQLIELIILRVLVCTVSFF